jgi:quercetin dioxygenase-like cupin family protein
MGEDEGTTPPRFDPDKDGTAAAPRPVKGQRMFTWAEPGEWITDSAQHLSYCWSELGVDEQGASTTVMVVRYEPGSEVRPHYHDLDYCSIVVEGAIEVTRQHHGVGSMRVVKAGTAYGPLRAGPDGCTVIDVFATGRGDSTKKMGITYLTPRAAQNS